MSRYGGLRVILAIVLLLNACTSSSSTDSPPIASSTIAPQPTQTVAATSTTAPANLPTFGGVVVIADDQEPPVLNPYRPGGDNSIVAMISQVHMAGAFEFAPSGELMPDLATTIPTEANGGLRRNDDGTLSVTWTIRDEAVWTDGIPVSGADFAFTLEYQKEPCSTRSPDALLDGEVEHVGPKSMTYRFDEPGFQFETALPWIVPKHIVANGDLCTDWQTTAWPAAGPFVLEQWIQGESMTFTRNENYWKLDQAGRQLPYLDRVEFRFVPEWEDAIDRFAAGEIQVVQPPAVAETIEQLRDRDGVEVQTVAGSIVDFLAFQFGPHRRNEDSLTQHHIFRAAVRDAIDRGDIVDAMWGAAFAELVNDLTASNATDPTTLEDVCVSSAIDCGEVAPGILVSTVSNSDRKMAGMDLVAEQLDQAGFDVDVVYEDRQLVFGVPLVGWWDLSLTSAFQEDGTAGLLERMSRLDPRLSADDRFDFFEWGRPGSAGADAETMQRVTARLDQAIASLDTEEVRRLADEINSIALDEIVMIPLVARPEVGIVWANRVDGFEMNATGSGFTWNIEQWRRLDL